MMNIQHSRTRGLVMVRAEPRDPNQILDTLTESFEAFRAKYDDRVEAMTTTLSETMASLAALQVGSVTGEPKAAISAAARTERSELGGYAKAGGDRPFAPKAALSTDSDPGGGYTVFPTISKTIQQKTFDLSPLGRLARYENCPKGDAFEEPWDVSDIAARWVGENDGRPELDGPSLRLMSVPLREIYTSQPVTQRLLDDTDFALGAWLEGKLGDKFARSEGAAFIAGDGVLQPRGLLTYDIATGNDAARGWGEIQYIPTGQSAGFKVASTTVSPADALFDTVYSLRAPYRANARWLMNLSTAGVVRKLKDSEGRFVWADAREGQPATLCGFPVELDEEMPDIGANSLSIAFGDFQKAYIVIGRPGLKLLRDPYTSKPNVLFYAYRRVGGGLQNSEAVKLLKFGTN